MQWVAVPRRRRRTTPLAWPPAVPRRAQRGRLGVGGRPIQRERFVARWRRRATVVASRPGHPNPGLCESPYRLSGGTRCVPLLSSPPCGPRAVPRLDAREQPRQRGSLPPGGCAVWPRARLRRRRLSSLVHWSSRVPERYGVYVSASISLMYCRKRPCRSVASCGYVYLHRCTLKHARPLADDGMCPTRASAKKMRGWPTFSPIIVLPFSLQV
jgi:hypothetical protein